MEPTREQLIAMLAEVHGRLNDAVNTLDKIGRLDHCDFSDHYAVSHRAATMLSETDRSRYELVGKGIHCMSGDVYLIGPFAPGSAHITT